jgi:iron complex transport system substrate-binding protein
MAGPPPAGQRARGRRLVAVLAAGACIGLAGFSSPAAAQLRVTDDRGVTLTLERAPQRIVSLLPSLTESVCALQACDRLVGVDRWSDWPASVRALPRLGGIDEVSVEALVRLKPDIVLAARSQRLLERLEGLGLKVLALDSDRHEDVRRSLATLGTLLGRPEAGAQAWTAIQAELARAAARVPEAWKGRSVYVEIGSGGYAAAASSFVGETLQRLGLANVAPADAGPFPKMNPEFVLRAQPQLLIGTARELRAMPSRPGWQALPALQRGQVCGFEAAAWNALVRPGPRLGEAAGLIVDCLVALPQGR